MNIKTVRADLLQNLYDEVGRLSDLKKIFHCGIDVLKTRMKELGVIRKPVIRSKVSISENELRTLYQNKTVNEISEILKCDHKLISILLSKYGIPFKERKSCRKYPVNELFFSELDYKSMYWLGFIAADGNVFKNRLTINLSSKDREHLEKFKKDINTFSNILIKVNKPGKIKTTEIASLRINSKRIVKTLGEFRVGPAKSLKFYIDNAVLNHRLLNLFILGFIDGDGCWSVRKNGQLSFSVCGSEKLCFQIREILVSLNLIPNKHDYIRRQGKIWTLNISGNKRLLKIVKWLYRDSSSFLERKRAILKNHYGSMIE